MPDPTLTEVAHQLDVSPATLRRWVREGVVPLRNGTWTPAAVAHARMVARLRARGHPLREIRRAAETGRLAFGYIEELFPPPPARYDLAAAAKESGLEPALIERVWMALGLNLEQVESFSEDDVHLLRRIAQVLAAGFPLVALLQLVRVYGQAIAQIADAEVKLFHLYVHEPLIREGVPGLEMAEEMQDLARDLLPLSSPIMDQLHQRALHHFVEQDVVGHLESEVDGELDLGRLRVAIAFADLTGYTRLTEELGEEMAVDAVERFVEAIAQTLPEDARVVKTIGDGVMIVGGDTSALVDWAVSFESAYRDRPVPRIGIHAGAVLYRDGDYFGRAVNLASRVAARAATGEVLVTREVVDAAAGRVQFEHVGEVKLKGFSEATSLYRARRAGE